MQQQEGATNMLHSIRQKEMRLKAKYANSVVEQRNKAIERKRLSSAYASKKPDRINDTVATVVPPDQKATPPMSPPASDITLEKFHYISIAPKHVTFSEESTAIPPKPGITVKEAYENPKLSAQKRAPSEHDASFFVPLLEDLCISVLASNFLRM